MISRWPGDCSLCGRAIPKGEDVHYDSEAKTIQHWRCFENPKPTAAEVAIAERLGFIASADVDSVNWRDVCRDLVLPDLSSRDRSPAARRPESETQRGSQPALFGS